jgi:hypothetical protein
MPPLLSTVLLLIASNVFMTFAWYGHLRFAGPSSGADSGISFKVLAAAVLASWGLAFFEYCLQVPGNRIGHAAGFSGAQLKLLQEVITLCVFVPFSLWFLKEKLEWDHLWAALCLVGAVFFVFRKKLLAA